MCATSHCHYSRKLEGQIIGRRPDFNLAHRLRLDKIQGETIAFDECRYTLINSCFQTVSEEQPYQLTREEKQIIDDLLTQFQSSPRLTKHMRFLMEKLLFTLCIIKIY